MPPLADGSTQDAISSNVSELHTGGVWKTPTGRDPKKQPSLVGKKFSRLTVLSWAGYNRHQQRRWRCRCDCGKEITTGGGNLTSGNTESCGCLLKEILRRPKGKKPEWGIGYGLAARNVVICGYKHKSRKTDRVWNLTLEQAEELLQGDCDYCGDAPSNHSVSKKSNGGYTYNGIDRIDNSKGYEMGNVVSCCRRCNIAKNDMTHSEFMDWVGRAYSRMYQKSEVGYAISGRK